MGGRIVLTPEPIDQMRERFIGIFAGVKPLIPPPTEAVQTKDVVYVSNRTMRIYIPANRETASPVGLYIHSGGWCAGDIEQEDFQCRTIAEKCGIILFSPDYRLAPENPYPAGLEDVCTAYEFMHNTANEHGGNPDQRFIMGGSAGGNLAACVALKYASNPKLKPSGLVVACLNSCDPEGMPEEYKGRYKPELYADSPMIGNEIVRQARQWYQGSPDDPLVSPLLHLDIKLLPSVYVAACTKDPTHQETLFFYEECKKQGVDAELSEWVGWPHFFWILPMLPKSAEFMEVWCEKLSKMIASQ